MSFPIVASFVALVGFVNTHQRQVRHFSGDSNLYLTALHASSFLGTLTCLALLAWYGYEVAWHWTPVLLVVGGLLGGLLFAWFDQSVGTLGMSLLSFVGWPVSAYFFVLAVRSFG